VHHWRFGYWLIPANWQLAYLSYERGFYFPNDYQIPRRKDCLIGGRLLLVFALDIAIAQLG